MAPMPRKQLLLLVISCAVCFLLGLNMRPPRWQSTDTRPKFGNQPPSASCPPAKVIIKEVPVQKNENSLVSKETTMKQARHEAAPHDGDDENDSCVRTTKKHYEDYFAFSQEGATLRKKHGTLKIAGFSRLWVPPLHGTGGMQYHALHLYSQMAALGHDVHVFVTGGPGAHRVLHFDVDKTTFKLKDLPASDASRAKLTIHQVASDKNGEYSETWFENCLKEFKKINATLDGGFQVAHSESWAGVPNAYQIGLQMAVTWHGSMFDWFRNEINLIVHNYRMKGKMTGPNTAHRMNTLGSSVAYEAYMLLTVPHHITISDSAANDLKEINLVDKERIHLIYNGVNPANFKPNPSARERFLLDHQVDTSHYLVGCGGRLEGIKGHHQLSKAMEIVLSERNGVTLLVAGTGGESTRYEALKKKGLNVVMLGMLKQDKLAQFYQSIDVFIDPFYQHHGLNTVMIEATLSGTPIIATGLASAKTTAPCADFGRTFGLGEVTQLADQIKYYQDNPEERKRVGQNVRERSLHLFTSTIMASSYEALLYTAWLNPIPLEPITGKVVCKHTYPAMCYREPS